MRVASSCEYKYTPVSTALGRLLSSPGDYARIMAELHTELSAVHGPRLSSRSENARRMANTQLLRAERTALIAALSHLVMRQFVREQGPRIREDPNWGTMAGAEEDIARCVRDGVKGFDLLPEPPLRDAHLPVAHMFHTAKLAVTQALTQRAEGYAEFDWLPGWIASNAELLIPYAAEFARAREGHLEYADDGGEKFRDIVETCRRGFERAVKDPLSSVFFVNNGRNLIGSVAAWFLADPDTSSERATESVLQDLQRVVMPAGHVSRRGTSGLPHDILRLDDVVERVAGRVGISEPPDGDRRYVDTDLNEPSPKGDQNCAGHQLGPSGGVADAAAVDAFYRALAAAVSPDGEGVEVGDTPSPETGRRDRTFVRPTEVAAAAYALSCHRAGVYPALTQAHRRRGRS